MPLIAGLLAGCADRPGADPTLQPGQVVGGATKQIVDVKPVAGFLPKPELLQQGGDTQPALVYVNPAVNLSTYHQFMLDPVTVWSPPDSPLADVPQEQRQALANDFYSDLNEALKKHCSIVTAPAPGVLHLRFAIVDAHGTNAAVNTVATYAPYASSAYSVVSFAFNKGVGYFAGSATIEGYGTDAVDNNLLWEAVDKRGGTTSLLENTLDTWLDVHHAFETWSDRLADRLVRLGACEG